MTRRTFAWVSVALVAVAIADSGRAAPVPKHLMPKDEPFCYMVHEGDRHVSTIGGRTITVVVTKVEKTDDGLMVTTEQEQDGQRTPNEVVLVSPRGIKVVEYHGKKLGEPFWWLQLPHADNNTWSNKWGGNLEQKWKTLGWEEIEVPAGKIRAMKVERTDGGNPTPTTYWWAPGMGCIKWSSGNSGRELTAFTPGK